MKLSLIVRGQHPPGDTVQHLRDDLDLVRCADSLGFDGIVKGSHFSAHPFESVQQIPFLSYCAAIAPRLRIICGLVLVPLHKPLDLAEQLATLDLLCGGKLVFGAGIGYRDVEFKAFGVPRGRLGARFEECLIAVRRLWSEDFVTMKGSDFELDH
ncbi:MAG: LLM class flavin-dependent oxidoreductase, partial [Acetobacteraceae bacterium]